MGRLAVPEDEGAALAESSIAAKAGAVVLIPARNEAATIGAVVRGCRRSGFAVVVIDDGSRDDTAHLARTAGAKVLTVPRQQHGKTAALHLGLRRVVDPEWIFFLDGDGQHRPADLERFWQVREDVDMVVGNRFPDAARMPLVRRWTNRVMSLFLRQSGVRDSQCGFRLVRRAWLGSWLPRGSHFQFETELALLAATRATRVRNLAIAAIYDQEQSKISPWRDTVNFARCLFRHLYRPT